MTDELRDPTRGIHPIQIDDERTAIDAVRQIAELTLPPLLTPPGEPDDRYYLREADGGYTPIDAKPKPRRRHAETVNGIVALIRLFAERARVDVFVGSAAVVAVCDEAGAGRDYATLKLTKSEQMKCLETDGLTGVGQQELVLKLSTLFRDQVEPTDFLPMVRGLRWKNNEEGRTQVRHDGGSYGMDVELAVAGLEKDQKIPETIYLNPPLYSNAISPSSQLGGSIECAVTADPSKKAFTIKPLPDQIALAYELAREGIARHIESDFEHEPEGTNRVVVHRDAIA